MVCYFILLDSGYYYSCYKLDGCICLSFDNIKNQVVLKYQLLNPAPYFQKLVASAQAIILAGGTMSPVSS
jgi:chromosome transmission fidelity protein 1